MSIIILKRSLWAIFLVILTLSPLTHALEEALGTPTTVSPSSLAVPIAQTDPATLLEAALQLREAKPALFGGALGVLIMKVVPGSQAEKVGLRRGDIVVAYQGKGINSFEGLVNTVQASADEVAVTLQFIRGEKVEEVVLHDANIGVELINIRSPQATELAEQMNLAIQVGDNKKFVQLILDNHDIAEEIFPHEMVENAKLFYIVLPLQDLIEEGKKAFDQSNYSLALEKWQVGLEKANALQQKGYIGHFLNNIGNVYISRSQYQKALDFYLQALAIARDIDDKSGEEYVLNNIGNVYYSLAQYPNALDYYLKSLAIVRDINDNSEEMSALMNIGSVYYSWSKYTEALDYYQRALAIGDKNWEGMVRNNIGLVYSSSGQYQKALDYYQQALAIFRDADDKYREGMALGNRGIVYQNLGQYKKATSDFQDGLTIFKSLGSLNDLWIDQRGLASTEVLLKQPKDAIQHFEQALDTIETLRTSLTPSWESSGIAISEIKTKFMEDKFDVYDEFITLLQTEHPKHPDKGYDRKAFEVFEKKQGRVFLEQMGKSTAWRFAGVPEETTTKDRDLENQVAKARKNLSEAYAKGKDVDPSPFRQHLEEVEKAQQAFEGKLKTEYPKYYALKYPQPVKLDDLQQNVLQEGEMLVIYNVREEATDLWLVGKQHFQMFSLPMTEAQVKEQVAKFRQTGVDSILKAIKEAKGLAEEDRRTRIANAVEDSLPDFLNTSAALYQQLLPESVQQLLKAAKPNTLYIVPTGALYSLPFEALVTEKGDSPHYLIQDYAVSYLSSASLLKTLRDAKQARHTEAQQPFLAFAHPVYDKTAFAKLRTEDSFLGLRTQAYLKLVGGGESFPELPDTAQEATGIAKVLKADAHYLKLRKEASKQQVLEEQHLDNFQYVLFAAHAVAPEKVTPLEQPALILSLTTPDQDAYLTMADVFGLSLKADLVTLSACNTGQGELVHGEGVLGLTRAFMYAGTPAVSVTLWKIEDQSSQALTTGLFTQLKEQKQALAAGLRQTKLNLLTTGKPEEYYRHPYFWAGMVVFGDGK